MNLSGMYDACEGILSTSAIQQKCCVECFHFSPRGNTEIVNQSHMVGACPPPRVKHFYRESLFLLIAFAGICSSTFFGITIIPARGLSMVSPLPWCLYHISSGRMSSLHILREDELQNNQLFFYYLGTCHHISSGRMSSLHILREDELQNNQLFFYYLGTCHHISSGGMSSLHILREDELQDNSLFFTTMVLSSTYPWGG